MSTHDEVIICDDLPADYVRFLYGDRLPATATIFSRNDALKERAARPARRSSSFKLSDVARVIHR